ncbi:hypothetical protein FRX31_021269, partial [Thalictrum thalictroides]
MPRSDESRKSKRKGGFKQKMGIKDKSNGCPTQDGDNRDSNEGSSSDGEEEDSDPSTRDSKMSKKPRGITNPTHVLDNSCKIKIIFNGRGQPVGETSIPFSTELGNIARDMVPLNLDDWRTIPMVHKNLYWYTIQ